MLVNEKILPTGGPIMSFKKIFILIAFTAAILMTFGFQNSSEHKVLFEKAKFTMETKGDLKGAINLFNEIIKKYPDEREYAAKSQLYIGLCYEKLGLKQAIQAQEAFKMVVDNYPEQTEAVKVAKEKLSVILKAQAMPEKGDKEFKIRQVWAGPDVDVLGEISSDGRYISYTDWGTGGLAIRENSTGKKRHLTEKGHYGFVLASPWSPDGKQIAYNWYNKDNFHDLRVIGLDGSKPKVLYRNEELDYVQPVDWSPDGKHILANFTKKDKSNKIVLVSVEDGSFSVLKTLDWGSSYMNFSPDGRYIVYDFPPQEHSSEGDIFVLSVDGKNEVPLVQHPADDCVLGWVPDGKNILFASDRTGTMDVWVIGISDGKPQGAPRRIKTNIGVVFPMGFTQSGSFYYGLRTRMKDVYIATFDSEKGKLFAPPTKASKRFIGSNFSAEWSSDGKYLAYVSNRAGRSGFGSHSIHILSLDTGEERELSCPHLTAMGGTSRGLRWSTDGRSFLTSGYDERWIQGLYIIDVETGDITLLPIQADGQVGDPTWSTDGKAIFYSETAWRKKISRILVYDLETKQKKEIYRQDLVVNWLALSPDGRMLAFVTPDPEMKGQVLKILPVSGGAPRELVKISLGCWSITWTADGQQILYNKTLYTASGQEKGYELWKISVEEGEPQKIWESTEYKFGELRVHPDGQRISFTSGKWSAEIWAMENFLPSLKDKN